MVVDNCSIINEILECVCVNTSFDKWNEESPNDSVQRTVRYLHPWLHFVFFFFFIQREDLLL